MRLQVTNFFIQLLTTPLKSYAPRFPNDLAALKHSLQKGDVLLIEGNQPVSEVIKYLTQSSWSHTAIYVGDELIKRNHPLARTLEQEFGEDARYLLVEAVMNEGVIEKNGRMKIHSVGGEVRNKDVHCLSILEQINGAVTNQYCVAYFIQVSTIITNDFVKSLLQLWYG